jgi:hypothetical protein
MAKDKTKSSTHTSSRLPEWTREDGEVFLTRPKTSHKKSGNFSAEVGKVLCRS